MGDTSNKSLKVLVLAPRFPAINQPWMDTYLEQLLQNDFELQICSFNNNPTLYHRKVDQLRLREKVVTSISPSLPAQLRKALISNPLGLIRAVPRALQLSHRFGAFGISRAKSFLKLVVQSDFSRVFNRADLIHGHEEVMSFEFLHFALFYNRPMVLTFHGLPPAQVPQLNGNKRKFLFHNCSKVLVNTVFARDQVVALGCPQQKTEILPQGLPLEDFPFSPKRWLPGETLNLLTVGRFNPEKGHRYAILAAARLVAAGVCIRYMIVGHGPDEASLKKLIARFNLAEHVELRGELRSNELSQLYSNSHVFVLPSIDTGMGDNVETQGVVLLEAQAAGCLIVASEVGGIPETLSSRPESVLVRHRSSREIANAILAFLDKFEHWPTLQESARDHVAARFSAEVIGTKMAKILRDASVISA